jgi:hypothetical protein
VVSFRALGEDFAFIAGRKLAELFRKQLQKRVMDFSFPVGVQSFEELTSD